MKLLLVFIVTFLSILSFAQKGTEWVSKGVFEIDSSDVWTTDVLGNVYVSKKELITKFDSLGVLKFSQSQKSIGRLSSIQIINTMRLIMFSEEQQEFCFLDNTLTPYESCVDLIDQNIGNATMVSVSSQPNKFWVFDQLNSRLLLLSLLKPEQSQVVENVKGILNSGQISAILESDNLLNLLDPGQGVFILDLYGSLVNSIKIMNAISFQMDDHFLYIQRKSELLIIDLETFQEQIILLPLENVIQFQKHQNNFYFRINNKILKYQLLFRE